MLMPLKLCRRRLLLLNLKLCRRRLLLLKVIRHALLQVIFSFSTIGLRAQLTVPIKYIKNQRDDNATKRDDGADANFGGLGEARRCGGRGAYRSA